eukprot:4219585-Prorocentrum_lima.AAC.1
MVSSKSGGSVNYNAATGACWEAGSAGPGHVASEEAGSARPGDVVSHSAAISACDEDGAAGPSRATKAPTSTPAQRRQSNRQAAG